SVQFFPLGPRRSRAAIAFTWARIAARHPGLSVDTRSSHPASAVGTAEATGEQRLGRSTWFAGRYLPYLPLGRLNKGLARCGVDVGTGARGPFVGRVLKNHTDMSPSERDAALGPRSGSIEELDERPGFLTSNATSENLRDHWARHGVDLE